MEARHETLEKLKREIEKARCDLSKMVSVPADLARDDVISKSHEVDQLIVAYYTCWLAQKRRCKIKRWYRTRETKP